MFCFPVKNCSDKGLENVENQNTMVSNCWTINTNNHIVVSAYNNYMDGAFYGKCNEPQTFWGYIFGAGVGSAEATFKGYGTATLDFGNCRTLGGMTKVFVNNVERSVARTNEKHKIITFEYTPGTMLRVEEHWGMMKISSLHLVQRSKYIG